MIGGEQRAYIGSFTSEGGHGITAASVDPATGALRVTGRTGAVADPSYLALSADRTVLYAVSEQPENGAAAAFSLRDPASPALLGEPVPVHGGAPTHLCLFNGYLVTADYASGSVSTLPVRPDGSLGTPVRVLRHEGRGPNAERQSGPHAHAVVPDPSGGSLLTVDLGTDSVRVCDLDRATGKLRVRHEVRLAPGSGPRHLTFHPRGHRAYVVNELGASLTVAAWEAATGLLRPLGEPVPLGEEGVDLPSEIVVSRDGRFAWAAVRGADTIVSFALDAGGDRLEPVGRISCGGSWPRDLVLDPAGRRLYAANQRSGDVTWFELDAATGAARRAGALRVPAASCLVFG